MSLKKQSARYCKDCNTELPSDTKGQYCDNCAAKRCETMLGGVGVAAIPVIIKAGPKIVKLLKH